MYAQLSSVLKLKNDYFGEVFVRHWVQEISLIRNPSDYSKLRSIANAAHTWKGLKFGCQFLLRILQLDWYLQYLVFLMYPWEELHLPKIFHAIFQSSSHLTRLDNPSQQYISSSKHDEYYCTSDLFRELDAALMKCLALLILCDTSFPG